MSWLTAGLARILFMICEVLKIRWCMSFALCVKIGESIYIRAERWMPRNCLKFWKTKERKKRCRKRNTRYFEATVYYEVIDKTVILYFCRLPYQKTWELYFLTDSSLDFLEMMESYAVRWIIEVFFRETKQYLQLGRCNPRTLTPKSPM